MGILPDIKKFLIDFNIAGPLAPIVGELRGTLETKALETVNDIKSRVKTIIKTQVDEQIRRLLDPNNSVLDCAVITRNVDALNKQLVEVKKKRDSVINFLQKAEKKLDPMIKLITKIKKIVDVAAALAPLLKLIPIPQAFIPIGITVIIADILNFLTGLIKALRQGIAAILKFLTPVKELISRMIDLLNKLDAVFTLLDIIKAILEGLCSRKLTLDDLVKNNLLLSDGTLILTTLLDPLTTGLDVNPNIDTRDLSGFTISNPTVGVDVVDCGMWVKDKNYYFVKPQETNLGKRDMVSHKGSYYLCNNSHYSTVDAITGPPKVGSYWEFLGSECEVRRAPKPILVDMLTFIIKNRATPCKDLNSEITKQLKFLQDSNLPDEIKVNLSILSGLNLGNTVVTSEEDPSKFYHLGPDGVLYKLEILLDESYIQLAPRHYVVARDPSGEIKIQGDKSFSSSVDVLLDEIKFRIDSQL